MNERIEQLANEVGISVEYLTNTKQWPLIEALAELIVRECSKVITHGGYWSGGIVGERRQCTPPEIAKMIREHFGVE